MNVLFFDFVTAMGGVPTVLRQVLPHLRETVEVRFLDPLESPLTAALAERGVKVVHRPMPEEERTLGWVTGGRNWWILIKRGGRYLAYSLWLARYIRSERIAVLCCSYPKSAVVAIVAGKLARVPVVYYNHGAPDVNHLRSMPFRFIFRNVKRVIAVSDDVKQRLMLAGVAANRIERVYNGVDLAGAAPVISKSLHSTAPVIIGFVGNLQPSKQVEHLIMAVQQLVRKGRTVKLWIIGSTPPHSVGDYGATLLSLTRSLELEPNVRFLGHRSDVERILPDIDILVLPSAYESFGMVLVEAMQHAKPCVASRVGGIPEVVDDGKTGYLFESGNVDDLADQLDKLVMNPEMRELMGRFALHRVQERFDVHIQAQGLAEALIRAASREKCV